MALTDRHGVAFLTNVPGWKYRPLAPLSGPVPERLTAVRQYGASPLEPITPFDLPHLERDAVPADIGGQRAAEIRLVARPLPDLGWILWYVADLRQAEWRAAYVTALAAVTLLALFALAGAWRQRVLRIREERDHQRALESRIDQRTRELRESNRLLVEEMHERQRAAEALFKANEETIHAGKMSALGQMAAAICHEVNQPIAAIRTYTRIGQRLLDRHEDDETRDVLSRIETLAEKMTATTSHLRTFARKSTPGRPVPVQVASVVDEALKLLAVRIRTEGIEIPRRSDQGTWAYGRPSAPPSKPITLPQTSGAGH